MARLSMTRGIASWKGVRAGLVYSIRFGPVRLGRMRFHVSALTPGLAPPTADVSLRGIRRLIGLLFGP